MDIKRLMSQMQNQFANTQKKLEVLEVEGSAGGDLGVFVKMNGKFQILDLKIKFLPKDSEDAEILEDLVKKAIGEAYTKIELEIKRMTSGMM